MNRLKIFAIVLIGAGCTMDTSAKAVPPKQDAKKPILAYTLFRGFRSPGEHFVTMKMNPSDSIGNVTHALSFVAEPEAVQNYWTTNYRHSDHIEVRCNKVRPELHRASSIKMYSSYFSIIYEKSDLPEASEEAVKADIEALLPLLKKMTRYKKTLAYQLGDPTLKIDKIVDHNGWGAAVKIGIYRR